MVIIIVLPFDINNYMKHCMQSIQYVGCEFLWNAKSKKKLLSMSDFYKWFLIIVSCHFITHYLYFVVVIIMYQVIVIL